MGIEIRTSKDNVNWERVSLILQNAGLSHEAAERQKLIFEHSYAVAFAYDGDLLIGCGRALSDGICQAAIYNIAVDPLYHGKQIGRAVIEALISQLQGCTIILYTHPQTIALYEKFGFRRQKTGMVLLQKEQNEVEWMEKEGFLLPKAYRFGDNTYEIK
jgi:ribosomal protein S18 acetylase RimI-like enzyme